MVSSSDPCFVLYAKVFGPRTDPYTSLIQIPSINNLNILGLDLVWVLRCVETVYHTNLCLPRLYSGSTCLELVYKFV